MHSSKKGSVLGASLVVALALTVVLAGLLKWTESEAKLARETSLVAKADYAAEATGEFALAQINSKLKNTPIITTNVFTTSGTPPKKPDSSLLGSTTATLLTTVSGSGGSGGLISDVIGLLGGLLGGGSGGSSSSSGSGSGGTSSSTESNTVTSGRFVPLALNLSVGPFSTETSRFIDPDNPLYADDPLRGQTVNVREVRILSAAEMQDNNREEKATAYCEHILQVRDTPLFGFMSFYNMDLELSPGAYMEMHGPVHTNGNLYVCSSEGLKLFGVVTTAKGVFHGRAPGSGMSTPSGDVSFKGASGSQVNLKQSGTWLESTATNWTTQALKLWGGNLLSSHHGVTETMPAAVPSYTPDNPSTSTNELNNAAHDIIEPAIPNTSTSFPGNEAESQKFASKACIVVEVTQNKDLLGTPTTLSTAVYKYTADSAGTYVRTTSAGTATYRRDQLSVPANLITLRSFYDARQAQTVYAADFDVGVLKTAIENDASAALWTNGTKTFAPGTEWNGVVYVEHKNPSISSSRLGAIRLVNGRYVPNRPTASNDNAKGFTIATNAPLYIKGNYNADGTLPSNGADIVNPETGEPPASVAGDAVTVLSNAWSDSNSTKSLSNRKASVTEIAAAVVAGVVPTNKGNNGTYSGGNHNLVRMLEDWNNVKIGYRSSMVVLFESELATKPWATSSIYSPPDRIYGLNKLFVQGVQPPGTPRARTYRRIGFRKLTEADYTAALAALGGS